MIVREYPIRVWYVHTDAMGIVHHSNYICYYESARSDLMRDLGASYAAMEAEGIMMPILDVTSRYLKPARYDEVLTVRVTIREMPQARVTFEYEILNATGDLLNTGTTTLGFMNASTRRPCRAPQKFLDMLRAAWE